MARALTDPPPPDPPVWLDELDWSTDGPPWLSMGLARLDLSGWLWPDEHRDEELALRRRLLADRHDEVFAALPGTEAAGAETLDLVRSWLAEHRPDLAVPEVLGAGDQHPLEVAGRLVQEDLCLMVPSSSEGAVAVGVGAGEGRRYLLAAACLCFPSHWRLADKIGRPAAVVHGPVPRYDDELATRVDRYLDRLRPEAPGWRRNWSVHESPDLFAPVPPAPAPVSSDAVPIRLWLRSERQTLRRLPTSGAVLFTIRVQQAPFGVLAARPDRAVDLAARLRAQPAALSAMNGVAPHLDAVLAWLDAVSVRRPPRPS